MNPYFLDFAVGWFGASGHTPQEVLSKLTVHELPSGDKPYLPSLIVNTGSGHLFMVVGIMATDCDKEHQQWIKALDPIYHVHKPRIH